MDSPVKMTPKSRKGKNRIKEFGTDIWKIVHEAEHVYFSDLPGPWFMVQTENPNSLRWVHFRNDPHFSIERV